MQIRIFSLGAAFFAAGISFTAPGMHVCAQDANGYVTDPATGIVYRPVTRTVERPVVETQIKQEERTVFRPQTVTDTKTEARTVYTPVVEYQWEPRLHGRWNPFSQPTVAYHHVPVSRWETRSEVVPRTSTRTEWIAEKQTVDVPQRIVRIERDQKTEYEAVGRVAPAASGASDQLASRLRPLDGNATVQPFYSQTSNGITNRIASDPSPSVSGGMRATELYPNSGYNQVLPQPSGVGVVGLPTLPFWR